MIRCYCDGCNTELLPGENKVVWRIKRRLQINGTPIMVEVVVATDGIWNGGHLCRECVLRTVDEGQDI